MVEAPRRRVFLDTNLLVYSAAGDPSKGATASALIAAGGVISAQVLNEFANVALRKLRFGTSDARRMIMQFIAFCPDPRPLTVATHEAALALVERHDFAFSDSLLVASALEAGCTTLLTEDMHHGLVVSGTLTIRNPFRRADV